MIYCTLDDKIAYPSTSEKIKVTYENQFIKDSGSYTYDITFPMDIAANRRIFGNVQRIDVKKTVKDFETCRLYANNRLVLSGKGTVTSISPDKVKVQIVGGKSRVASNLRKSTQYIDQIGGYDDTAKWFVNHIPPSVRSIYSGVRMWADPRLIHAYGYFCIYWDVRNMDCIGEWGKFCFNPIVDEDNDQWVNSISVYKNSNDVHIFCIYLPSPHPWFFYVVKNILKSQGWTLDKNEFDVFPWNQLVIASSRTYLKSSAFSGNSRSERQEVKVYGVPTIESVLPHWTVADFIERVERFLGGSFVFHEGTGKVDLVKSASVMTAEAVSYECIDEYSTESNDSGVDAPGMGNEEYDFPSSSYRPWQDYISNDVRKAFPIKNYASKDEVVDAVSTMDKDEAKATIFRVGNKFYVYTGTEHTWGTRNTTSNTTIEEVGWFSPLIRDEDTDDATKLYIVPVAINNINMWDLTDNWFMQTDPNKFIKLDAYKELLAAAKAGDSTEKASTYVTVEDAMNGTSVSDSDSTDSNDEQMQVYFATKLVIDWDTKTIITPASANTAHALSPLFFTDVRQYDNLTNPSKLQPDASLSLLDTNQSSLGISHKSLSVDTHHEFTIKFITDDIPDPAKIYIFHNKRYICQKVELNVTNDGIDKEKTGYFYELL